MSDNNECYFTFVYYVIVYDWMNDRQPPPPHCVCICLMTGLAAGGSCGFWISDVLWIKDGLVQGGFIFCYLQCDDDDDFSFCIWK